MGTAAILPQKVRKKIIHLFREGYSTEEVFNKILNEAIGHVKSPEELTRCIASLEGKVTQED